MQLQDIFKRIPSTANMCDLPVENPPGQEGKVPMPRVASLDFIRAYFNCRQNNATGDLDIATAIKPDPDCPDVMATLPSGAAGVAAAAAESPGLSGSPHALPIAMLNPMGSSAMPIPTVMPGPPQTFSTALASGQITPAMLSYIAAVNAAAMHGAFAMGAVPSVPTSATGTGAGGSHDGIRSGYSSGAGDTHANTAPAAKRRCTSRGDDPQSGEGEDGGSGQDKVTNRRERRMLSNRESARRSRKRKQEHLAEVEQRLAASAAKCARLEEMVAKKEAELAALHAEVQELRSKVQTRGK